VVKVSGRGSGRVSLAAALCLKPGARTRLVYRAMVHRGRRSEKKGFREADFARLLDAVHTQLGGPVVLVRDNAPLHTDALMRDLIAARSWLTVFQLPSYAPELNPDEDGWAHLKLDFNRIEEADREDLRRGKRQSHLVDAFHAGTMSELEHDEVAEGFLLYYQQVRRDWSEPEDVLWQLKMYVLGNAQPRPKVLRAALVVLAHFFDRCDIFEAPPTGWRPDIGLSA
jgi:transposase